MDLVGAIGASDQDHKAAANSNTVTSGALCENESHSNVSLRTLGWPTVEETNEPITLGWPNQESAGFHPYGGTGALVCAGTTTALVERLTAHEHSGRLVFIILYINYTIFNHQPFGVLYPSRHRAYFSSTTRKRFRFP